MTPEERADLILANSSLSGAEALAVRTMIIEQIEGAVKEERDACANLIEDDIDKHDDNCDMCKWLGLLAVAIRARGEK